MDSNAGSDDEFHLSAEEIAIVSRVESILRGSESQIILDNEKQAMRAFLQRGETRLSTYQRVAGVFLNGAGLLVLLPGFARDAINSVVKYAVNSNHSFGWMLFIPLALSIALPIYAFVLLVRDLVQFYFSPQFLENDPIRINRFALAGLTFPVDESIEGKAQVIAFEVRDAAYSNFTLGGTSPNTIKRVYDDTAGGNAAFPLRAAIQKTLDLNRRPQEMSIAAITGLAMSLGGSLDLTLVQEVARMEASIARHVLQLRKLVLRYTKALIMFVATTIFTLVIGGIEAAENLDSKIQMIVALGAYTAWSIFTMLAIRMPVRWIDFLVNHNGEPLTNGKRSFKDPDLQHFETRVFWVLAANTLICMAAAWWVYRN